jgi:D-3-phosphoglycerate dehydrogenase / 2-oxoglutarate reductase
MTKVLISPAPLAGLDAAFSHSLREAGFQLVYPARRAQMTEDELQATLAVGIRAALAGSEPYTRRVLEANRQLRVIARAGVGYDAVDVAAATDLGVAVCIAPGTNQDAVAEHTFTLLLALAKGLVPQHLGTCALKWPRRANLPLRGRTLGIAGLGRIGKAMAIRGACFGMRLLAYEPFPDRDFAAQYNVGLVSLEQLLAESDYLSLHMPATAASRHLINRDTLRRMKPTAFLLNTARGAIVNEAHLIEALQAGRLAGAGLDVFEEEPPADSPLLHMDNVVVTPHAAGVDLQSRDDMALSAAEAIIALSRGQWPAEKIVNPEVRERFRW